MQELFDELQERLGELNKIVLSAPSVKGEDTPDKICVQRKTAKNAPDRFFAEEFRQNKAFHKTLTQDDVSPFCRQAVERAGFRQINAFLSDAEIAYRISKKGKLSRTVNRKAKAEAKREGHNRKKEYLIPEGEPIPFMTELGVFTAEGKVVQSKYDKFRQINRFVELLDHAFQDYEKDEIYVLDFGCGKSYLPFLVYYYFSVIRNKKVHITGYDLKRDVVAHCNDLAERYGYENLTFVIADVTRDRLSQEKIDFVISLHACDVATDYAIHFALEHRVPYLFSVPCCQHEINSAIRKGGGDLDLFLSHGLLQERASALLTDAFRVRILELEGYRTDVLEFVDFAHSPKNLMIRAKRKQNAKRGDFSALLETEARYGFRQTLLHLREESK